MITTRKLHKHHPERLTSFRTPRSPTPIIPFLITVSFVQCEEQPVCDKAAHTKSSVSTSVFHKHLLCEHSSLGAAGGSPVGAEE